MKTTNDEVISSWLDKNLNPLRDDSALTEATVEIDDIKTPIKFNLSDKHIQKLIKDSVTYKAFYSFYSWKTCDTNESISNIFAIDLYSGRTVYLLQPGSEPIAEPYYMGYGKFGGKNAYAWLAEMNLPFVQEYSEEEKTKAGKLLQNGSYFENTVTGVKWMYQEEYEYIDLQRSLFPGIELLTMQTTMESYHYTCDYENTIEIKFSSIYPIIYPLKFSYDKNACYERFPASEVCSRRGIVYSTHDRYIQMANVYYSEEEYFWDFDEKSCPPLLILDEDKYCVRKAWCPIAIKDYDYKPLKSGLPKELHSDLKVASLDTSNDFDAVLKAVRIDGRALQYASDEMKNDRYIVLEAIINNNEALLYASEELKTDQYLVKSAIIRGPVNIFEHHCIRSIYCDDEMIASLAIKRDGVNFRYVSDRLKADRDFVFKHIKYYQNILWEVSEELSNDKEILLEAVKHHFWAYEDVPEKLLEDRDIVLAAVKNDGSVLMLRDTWANSDREIVYEAVKSNREAFIYASEELQAELQQIVHNSGNDWRDILDHILYVNKSEYSGTGIVRHPDSGLS